MIGLRARGHRGAAGLFWVGIAALLLAVVVPSMAATAAASPNGAAASFAPAAAAGFVAGPVDPPSSAPTIVASLGVGSEPLAGVADLGTGLVYVANSISNNVTVLNGTAVDATIALPGEVGAPDYVVYDGGNGYVYVVDRYDFESSGGAVSVINGTSVVATVTVGHQPNYAVLDPADGDLYVTNSAGTAVSVINGTTELASVPVGSEPSAAAYSPVDEAVFVANEGSANVSVLAGTTVAGTVPAGLGPDAVAYDPSDGDVYVANNVSDNVTVYDGLSVLASVPVGPDPSFVGYAPSVAGVEVANTNDSSLTVIVGTSATANLSVAAGPVWAGPGPSGGFTYVVGSAANAVTILSGTSPVRTVAVGSVPTYGIADPANGLLYVTNSGSNNVTVLAVGQEVLFNETGLGAGTTWSVDLGGTTNASSSSSIGFLEASGVYGYTIGTPTGYVLVGASPASPVTVADAPVLVNVTFALPPSVNYTLTFDETGLTGCHGHGNSSGHQGWGNGGGGGGGGCCRGSSSSLSWNVTVNGVTKSTTNSSLAFSETNGTYNYTVQGPSGYSVTSSVPASPVTINGANVTVNVTFAKLALPRTLSITFEENGLPWGTVWCVTLNTTVCSSGRMIVFSGLSAGNYSFNVSPVAGYTASPQSGTVRLSYQDVTVLVRFSQVGHHHGGC